MKEKITRSRTSHCSGSSPRLRFAHPRIRAGEFGRSAANTNKMHPVTKILITILLSASFSASADDPQITRLEYLNKLETFLKSPEVDDFDGPGSELSNPEKWAFEAGESAIPILKPLLSDTHVQRQFTGGYLLAIIGGPTSRDVLLQEYHRAQDTYLKTLLCFCMASTGESKDIDFLIESLKGAHYGRGWPPIEAAALSLGILRPSRAIPALTACAAKNEGIASHAAEQALYWFNSKPAETPQLQDASEREQIILTMLRFGIARTEESSTFYEKERNLKWLFRDGSWKFQQIDSNLVSEHAPTIHFDVHINQNRTKALVAVGMTFGPLNGKGYNYVLNKENGGWKVIGIISTWIS